MIDNNLNKHLDIAIDNINAAKDILTQKYNAEKEEPKENKKVTLKVKVVNPFDGVEIDEKELEQIRKDLEEIINDFTRK